jgi:RNA exonuclease 4
MQQYVAMDCEMVGVGDRGYGSAVARVTLVDWHGSVLLDTFVKPERPVTDYRTFVSGITADDLNDALDLATCRSQVTECLQGKVLIGHALKNDLHALGIQHPWHMVRDTAKYEPFMKVRFDDGILWPRKLKDLVYEHLQEEIQPAGQPHSAFEDAAAALNLYKLVRTKWEKIIDYKVSRTREIEQMRALSQVASTE